MHLHTEVHFVWNMIEGIEPPTFPNAILRINFRPKHRKRGSRTEVSDCDGRSRSAARIAGPIHML